jgi:hypothetical protein
MANGSRSDPTGTWTDALGWAGEFVLEEAGLVFLACGAAVLLLMVIVWAVRLNWERIKRN